MDEIDRKILEFLQEDPRKAYREIADEINVSEGTVRYRLKKLKEQGILSEGLLVRPEKVGLTFCAVLGIQCQPRAIESVGENLSFRPEINMVFHTSGDYDIIAIAHFYSKERMLDFLKHNVYGLEGVIRCTIFDVLRKYKVDLRVPF